MKKKNSHQMLNPIIFLLILLSIAGWLPTMAIATENPLTTLNVPGAMATYAFGTDGNNIVGYDDDASDIRHAFLAIPVSKPITMEIEPACFNQSDKGIIPVGIFGSADLDVTQINIDSLSLQGLTVRIAGQSNKHLTHYDYVNDDNHLDLIVQFQDSDGRIAKGNGYVTLTGKLNNDTPIEGKEKICIIP